MYVPQNSPDRCPACGDDYESVSRHADGFVVNLLDNERYRRVCFYPARSDDGDPALDCFHHTHATATGMADAADDEPVVPTERS
ncbi:hypothetical protein [Halorubrum tibetense]|uniref:DUF8145 domain-containing protein n=1 Tax=Halorubrum tibetense TaxID=175631 RepID=A0ABD5SAT9_9EURY